MPVKWADYGDAFLASDPGRDSRSWKNTQTSAVRMSFVDVEHGGPPPEDEEGWHQISDARELDLKQALVRAFVTDESPALQDDKRHCFSRRSGGRALKDLLAYRSLCDPWHRYEEVATRCALLAWAAERSVEVVELPSEDSLPGNSL